jgi:hypothetical protein
MKKTVILFILLYASYFLSAQNGFSSSIFNEDSTVSNHSLLCILDSTNEIQSNKTFEFYDNDNYLQIEEDYAIFSFRIRGKIEFYSGRIYRSGKLLINDSILHYALAFQSDNHFDATNQGKRNFIAYRICDNSKCEILLCSNTFVPHRKINAHLANDIERKALIEKSINKN